MTTAARTAGSRRTPAPVPGRLPRRPSPAPRRISGPAGPRSAATQPLPARVGQTAAELLRGLPDHRLIDGLVRGRAWIPVLGVLLAGVVATQVEVLKLGASMGRWMERGAALSSRNQTLQASVAALSDDQRIERLAARMGMVMPVPTAITFLSPHPAGGVRSALARIRPSDPTQFLASMQSLSVPPPAPVAPAPVSTPASTGASAGTQASTAATATGTATAAPVTTASGATGPTAPSPTGTPAATTGGATAATGAASVGPSTATSSQSTTGG